MPTLPTSHRLFPHERWLAAWTVSRQAVSPTPALVRQQEKYGPEGIVLLTAGRANLAFGLQLTLLGIVLWSVSGNTGPWAPPELG